MTGNDLPHLRITGYGRVPHIDGGVLDISAPQAVLHDRDIHASVQQMDRDRMAPRMKMLLSFRKARTLTILLQSGQSL
jgi:hypothetical protein